MKEYKLIIENLEKTDKLAQKLGKVLFPGAVIALEGDLGAGKTTFTKGIAKALNIKKNVNSPTFTIIKEYSGDLNLYHMDVYRLNNEYEDLGFDEYFYNDGITVIEWASKIYDQLPVNRLNINIYVSGESERIIEVIPFGEKYQSLCEEVFNV